MDSRILIFSRKELKIIFFGTMVGAILQIVCSNYVKNHPELLDDQNHKPKNPVTKSKKRSFLPSPRGGAFIEGSGLKIVINIGHIIVYLGKKGFVTSGVLLTSGIIVKKAATSRALTTAIRNSLASIHLPGEKTKFALVDVDGNRINLDQCDQNLKYLFKILSDENIPFEEKKKLAYSVFMTHLDLETPAGCVRCIFCIIWMLQIFSVTSTSSYLILFQNLLKALKEGKISKRLARLLVRRLVKQGIHVDPDLISAAS